MDSDGRYRAGIDIGGTFTDLALIDDALIERKGARAALLTTEGFRDAVAIGTEHRYDMYDVFLEKARHAARNLGRLPRRTS